MFVQSSLKWKAKMILTGNSDLADRKCWVWEGNGGRSDRLCLDPRINAPEELQIVQKQTDRYKQPFHALYDDIFSKYDTKKIKALEYLK